MNKAIFLLLLAGGVVLIIIGINGTNSISSELSRFFTGSLTNNSVGALIGGILASLVGLAGMLRRAKKA